MKKFYILSIILSFLWYPLWSQISHGGKPYSFDNASKISSTIPEVVMPYVDVDQLLIEDSIDEAGGLPWRFGKDIEVDYKLSNSGLWETLENGDRLWRLKITSPGAFSVNLIYENFFLPPGSKFFLYNVQKNDLLGSYTFENNKQNGIFSTMPTSGEITILEYYEPKNVSGLGSINIYKVIHGYKSILFGENNISWVGPCHHDIACKAAWSTQADGVAMVLVDYNTRICSGSMINNASGDCKPYFLTADHCPGPEASWIFMFKYQRVACDPGADGTKHYPEDNTPPYDLYFVKQGQSNAIQEVINFPGPNFPKPSTIMTMDMDLIVESINPAAAICGTHYKIKVTTIGGGVNLVGSESCGENNFSLEFAFPINQIIIESENSAGPAEEIKIYYKFDYTYKTDNPISNTLTNSTLKASSNVTDFKLVELSTYPPAAYNAYLNGWSRDETEKKGTSIHHPDCGVKKISMDTDNNYEKDKKYGTMGVDNKYWKVEWDYGGDMGGSSGGPLFDEGKRIVGQLSGGGCYCNGNDPAGNTWFGMLSQSWDGDAQENRLKDWLDPDNVDPQTVDGVDCSGPGIPVPAFIADKKYVKTGNTVKFQDCSLHSPIDWNWTFEGGNPNTFNGQNPPDITYNTAGEYDVTLTISSDGTNYYSLTEVDYITVANYTIWTGSNSIDWNENANWNPNIIPTINEDVLIPLVTNNRYPVVLNGTDAKAKTLSILEGTFLWINPGGKLDVSGLTTCDGIIRMGSENTGLSSSFIDNSFAGAGSIIYYRHIKQTANPNDHKGWHFISTPVEGFSSNYIYDYYLNWLDETHNDPNNPDNTYWVHHAGTKPGCVAASKIVLDKMKGWSVKYCTNYTCGHTLTGTGEVIEFMGSITDVYTGDLSTNFTASGPDNEHYNLLGNPYLSSIDATKIFDPAGPNNDGELEEKIVQWDGDGENWVTWTTTIGSRSNLIAPTQGFLISADVNGGDLELNNSMRAHNGDFYKNSISYLLVIEVLGNGYSDKTYIRFLNNTTNDFDENLDAIKLFSGVEEVPQIYTSTSSEYLTINALPNVDNLNLYFEAGISGYYEIRADEIIDFTHILLLDKKTGKLHDLFLDIPYKFYYSVGEENDRFIIHFSDVSQETENKGFVIYSNQDNIIVYNINNQQGDVSIYNIVGQFITSQQLEDGLNNITLDNANGYYIVNVRTSENVVNKKVYIH